jgi:hypothetical protein
MKQQFFFNTKTKNKYTKKEKKGFICKLHMYYIYEYMFVSRIAGRAYSSVINIIGAENNLRLLFFFFFFFFFFSFFFAIIYTFIFSCNPSNITEAAEVAKATKK